MSSEGEGLPLTDLRVVEAGQLLAGPFCAQLLGDFGAQVIKLEDPKRGDPMRDWGREKFEDASLWWPVIARNKKSVTCNLRDEEGQDIARQLIVKSDVLVENFRPGTMERWGLGWDELHRLNPGLIMVRVTGYGQTGPYAGRAGFGSIGEAMGGIRYTTGSADRPPSRTGVSLGDSLAGTFAALGALVAIHERTRSGEGQVVDSAIYEAVLALMESLIPEWAIAGYRRERTGSILPNVAPSNVYPSKDAKDILIAANGDGVFARLSQAMGMPGLATDRKYDSHTHRGENQAELDAIIEKWTSALDSGDILKILHEHGVPAGQTYTAEDMLLDPHFIARESVVHLKADGIDDFPMQNVFPRLSRTPGAVRSLGPRLGGDTCEVLKSVLQMTGLQIADLAGRGVV